MQLLLVECVNSQKNDFTKKASLRYLAVGQKRSRGMYLLLDCTEKGNIDFSWRVFDSNNSKARRGFDG